MGKTLAEKVWDDHVVVKGEDGKPDLLYIDLHLVHEVTSPQAFDGLRQAGARCVASTSRSRPRTTHPTLAIDRPIADPTSRTQIETLRRNCAEFGVRLHSLGDKEQGHRARVGPQLGLTMPGITVVCGESPHVDPRRVRRDGVRHRHVRGRARLARRRCRSSPSRRWRSRSRGPCVPATRRRTSSSPSSRRSAPAAGRATCSSTAAPRSARSRWRAA